MNFLAPILLGGLALVALPILIHRIRRPERDVVRFSSLMFVPDVPKEVIERRKIQHFLLLLLRILLLVLLALAFSRPFWTEREQAVLSDREGGYHFILVDNSLSMVMGERFAKAVEIAEDLIKTLPANASVALATFDRQTRLLQDFTSPNHSGLRDAVRTLAPGSFAGDYMAGLKFAERALLNQQADNANREAVLHLISDFQVVETQADDWRLSGRISFQGHQVDGGQPLNLSIGDAEVRSVGPQLLQVATRVKYWHGRDPKQISVALHFQTEGLTKVAPISLVLEPGSGSLAVFDLEWEADKTLTGYLEIDDDDLSADNRRYFHWEPDPKQPLNLVTDEPASVTRTASWFLEQAIGSSEQSEWELERLTPEAWASAAQFNLANQAVVLVGLERWSKSRDEALTQHLNRGGRVLVMLDDDASAKAIVDGALAASGLGFLDQPSDHIKDHGFETWQWVAFDHPIFAPFGAARFNDFSQIRFFKRLDLQLKGSSARALAKSEAATLVAEANLGKGLAIVWGFKPELAWSNFPKNIKFVPVLEETLQYLVAGSTRKIDFETGSSVASAIHQLPADIAAVRLPDGREWDIGKDEKPTGSLDQSGFLMGNVSEDQTWEPVAVVNPSFAEGNPQQWTVSEFALRLATNPGQIAQVNASDDPQAATLGVRLEFGYAFLWIIGLLLALETWLAYRLSRSQSPKPSQKGAA